MNIQGFHLRERRLFAGVAIGVLVGVLGVGAVSAASPAPSGPAPASGAPVHGTGPATSPGGRLGLRPGGLRQAIRRNFRVDITATNKDGTHTILYVRGTLKVGASTVTVTLPDNSTQTFGVDASTVVRDHRTSVPLADFHDGDRALVVGSRNNDGSYTATLIRRVTIPAAGAAAPTAGATP